jgi:hypothetical protein
MCFGQQKMVLMLTRVSVAHKPHAILRIDLHVETISSLFGVTTHHVHPHI